MPRFNGKYKVTAAHLEALLYIISMPNFTLVYTTFHASELQPYQENNNATSFPSQELACAGPIIMADGEEEWQIEGIINEQK